MTNFTKVITTVFLTVGFCASHSFLSSNWLKLKFLKKFGNFIAYYRLGYNLISGISLIIIFLILPKIEIVVYSLPAYFNFVVIPLQILSFTGLIWCARYFNVYEFIGLSQLKRIRSNSYNQSDLDEKSEFRIDGPYKYSRHPVYFFSIMLLVLRSEMGLTYFIIVIIFTLYFYVGSLFEEKRLIDKFGSQYVVYQKSVPRIFPVKIFKT